MGPVGLKANDGKSNESDWVCRSTLKAWAELPSSFPRRDLCPPRMQAARRATRILFRPAQAQGGGVVLTTYGQTRAKLWGLPEAASATCQVNEGLRKS